MRFDFDTVLKGTLLVGGVVLVGILCVWIRSEILRSWDRENACAIVGGTIIEIEYHPACVKLGELQAWNIE